MNTQYLRHLWERNFWLLTFMALKRRTVSISVTEGVVDPGVTCIVEAPLSCVWMVWQSPFVLREWWIRNDLAPIVCSQVFIQFKPSSTPVLTGAAVSLILIKQMVFSHTQNSYSFISFIENDCKYYKRCCFDWFFPPFFRYSGVPFLLDSNFIIKGGMMGVGIQMQTHSLFSWWISACLKQKTFIVKVFAFPLLMWDFTFSLFILELTTIHGSYSNLFAYRSLQVAVNTQENMQLHYTSWSCQSHALS